jgi:hypothetical protein
MSKRDVRYLLVLRMEQLKVGTNDLPSAVKKKVITAAALVSSTEAFSTVGLALQLEVPTVAATNIPDQKVGEECWNSDLDGRLETMATSVLLKVVAACIHLEAEVATTSEATRLWETLPTTSQVFGLYENPVT